MRDTPDSHAAASHPSPPLFRKPANVYLLGLTGGIACGKSTVVAMLAELGVATLDADAVTRQLQEPGQPVYAAIVAAFGAAVVQPDGTLDRQALAARVFSDAAELARLEALVHPAVRAAVQQWLDELASTPPVAPATRHIALVDAIKLIEGGWTTVCDATWVVTCPREQQVARLMTTRGMSAEVAHQRIDAQMPQHERVQYATVVIDNSGSLAATREQVVAAWQAVQHLVADSAAG